MTREEREEAKNVLSNISKAYRNFNNKEIISLERAIQALKQEPCDDAISRQAVLALAKEECDTAIIPYRRFVKDINALPPVIPKQKTGHWTNGNAICPCCGEDKFKDLDADIWADWQPKYCPNYGAKMEI